MQDRAGASSLEVGVPQGGMQNMMKAGHILKLLLVGTSLPKYALFIVLIIKLIINCLYPCE